MYQKGTATSLQDLIAQFLLFAQASDGNIQSWELVDDRLSSFYGATLKVPMKMYKDINGAMPYFYISFQHTNVDNNTYANWLRNGVVFLYESYIPRGSGLYGSVPTGTYYQSELYNHAKSLSTHRTQTIRTKYGSDDWENVFKNTGEFVAVGCHTHFDKDLWMCEQGGITCRKEAMTQINTLNLLKARQIIGVEKSYNSWEAVEGSNISLPAFPGTGCPWFTLSNANKSEFTDQYKGFLIEYWFIKTDYSASITLKLNGYFKTPDVYQSISFGMMDGFDNQSYLFPLFVAGGNVGISQDFWTYLPIEGTDYVTITGNSYDLDIRNTCMSNSNLLHPTKFNGANVSNFKVMSPEGEWKDIYTHNQTASLVGYFSCGYTRAKGMPLNAPTNIGHGYHSASPGFGDDVKKTIDTYAIKEKLTPFKFDTPFQKIIVALNQNLDHGENGIIGVIPNTYMSWSRTMLCGEIEIDGKKYLSVPNGWDKRMWKYPTKVGVVINDEWENDVVRRLYDSYIDTYYTDIYIRDRLLLLLE